VAINLRACLASPASDVDEARKALEAIYSAESEEPEVALTTTTTSPSELDKSLYAKVCKSREAGKARLQNLLDQFEHE